MKKITNEILEERIEGQKLLFEQKLTTIETKIDELISTVKIQNGRIGKLEEFKNKLVGVSIIVSGLVSAIFKKIL